MSKKAATTAAAPARQTKARREIPTSLSFARSHNPGLFLMYGRVDDKLVPVEVTTGTVLGTSSHYMADARNCLDKESGNPIFANPQQLHRAYLPAGADTLVVKGAIRIIGGSFNPESCNDEQYLPKLQRFVEAFREAGGYEQLAERYLMNAINGRWLWRNRLSPKVQVKVTCEDVSETFDANAIEGGFSLSIDSLPADKQAGARALASKVAQALQAKSPLDVKFLELEADVYFGAGAEVYPSQQFREKNKNDKGGLSKYLAHIELPGGVKQAVLHDQKVGNGIRTIDTWYREGGQPISVEPYGSVPRKGRAERLQTEGARSFYELQDDLEGLTANLKDRMPEALYFGAMLIRGGLFGRGDKNNVE